MGDAVKAKKYFLNVVSAVLLEKDIPRPDEELDFSVLYRLAVKNKVESIIYQAFLPEKATLPQEEFKKLQKAYLLCMMRQTAQEEEVKILRKTFSEHNIEFMLLKGAHLKALYPSSELRFMVDMDILLNEADIQFGKDTLISRGFTLDFDNGKDIVFVKKPFLTIELHRSLFQEDYFMYPYFTDCMKNAEKLTGTELKMSDNDLYVYTLAHLAEHYTSAGSCFRPCMDLYLMEKKYTDLDFSYINACFEKMGILEFANNIRRLCKCMFEAETKDETLEMMESYIVLGPPVQNASAASEAATSGKSKFSLILSALFPDFKHMSLKYPILKKLPFLLPLLWLVRIAQYTFTKDTAIVKKKRQLKNSEKKSADILGEIFKKSGL